MVSNSEEEIKINKALHKKKKNARALLLATTDLSTLAFMFVPGLSTLSAFLAALLAPFASVPKLLNLSTSMIGISTASTSPVLVLELSAPLSALILPMLGLSAFLSTLFVPLLRSSAIPFALLVPMLELSALLFLLALCLGCLLFRLHLLCQYFFLGYLFFHLRLLYIYLSCPLFYLCLLVLA